MYSTVYINNENAWLYKCTVYIDSSCKLKSDLDDMALSALRLLCLLSKVENP